MKRFFVFLFCLVLSAALLCGCTAQSAPYEKFTIHFYSAFDTFTQIIGYSQSEETFAKVTKAAQEEFERLHMIFDRYHPYEGVNNLYLVNENAAGGPVPAEPELIELLLFCRSLQETYPDRVNVAMGAVLDIWHDYRELGTEIPPMDMLAEASAHCDFDSVVIDEKNGTVAFTDPDMLLDVGSVAKGWAVERVAQQMLKSEMPSFLISAGGNVRAGEAPRDDRLYWGVSIQDPNDVQSTLTPTQGILDILYVKEGSVVTSGDYQRYYEVDGVRYHHIIDPKTLMPSSYVRAVTVWAEDSGLADLLSTTLFLSSYEEGRALVESADGVEAFWVLNDGTIEMTEGMRPLAYSQGATSSVEHKMP